MTQTEELVSFRFSLIPAHTPEQLHENIRSSLARDLPAVVECSAHDGILAIAGGGPSLQDSYSELTGFVAAINGSLSYLLDRDVLPHMCGVCDPSPHMVDIVEADKRVTYFLSSTVHPTVYDKLLNAGCRVFRWNISSVPGSERLLADIDPLHSLIIGGGSTMGLRWLTLGYSMGFRKFHLHGMDSSFRVDPERGKASHAYKDHQDDKEWITFDGYQTRVNFIGQLCDFLGWLDRFKEPDVEPLEIRVFGDGLLQSKFKQWKELNPGWHEGGEKPKEAPVTEGFEWPEGDKLAKLSAQAEVWSMAGFMAQLPRRNVAVQAGGNVGVYPAHLARYFREVLTFEPDEENFALLSRNIAKCKGNIAAYQAALGEVEGTCSLVKPDPENTGAIRVAGDDGEVPMQTIDSLKLPQCDLIWLDIEGGELNALKGAGRTITMHKPWVIIEENESPMAYGLPLDGARRWLTERGYEPRLTIANDTMFAPC